MLTCGARRRYDRGRCRAPAMPGRTRGRWHGGAATGPRTPEGMQRTVVAMVAGRKRWLDRMRRAKALGLVEKIPTGRRRPGIQKASSKAVARARGIASQVIASRPGPGRAKRQEGENLPDCVTEIFMLALQTLRSILDRPATTDPRLARLQMRIALYLIDHAFEREPISKIGRGLESRFAICGVPGPSGPFSPSRRPAS